MNFFGVTEYVLRGEYDAPAGPNGRLKGLSSESSNFRLPMTIGDALAGVLCSFEVAAAESAGVDLTLSLSDFMGVAACAAVELDG